MHLEGSHQLAASPEAVWKLLNDPDVLAKLTPGLAELNPQEKEDSFEAVFQIKMGPINSGFTGTLEVRDKSEPLSYQLVIGVKGRIGTIDAEGTFGLRPKGSDTDVSFSGDARMTGVIARMGQRVLSGVAKMFTNQFFQGLERELLPVQGAVISGRAGFTQEASMAIPIHVTVNGEQHEHEVEPRLLLVQYLREVLTLTGTHVGCDTSSCGACTVIFNGRAVKSCTLLAVQADGAEITTIEGLAPDGELHPIQNGFHQEHGLQCGFCTPGMILTAWQLLERNPDPTDDEIRHGIEGNYCRCTGYDNIVRSVKHAANELG
mgnify:CR=1 FL=1